MTTRTFPKAERGDEFSINSIQARKSFLEEISNIDLNALVIEQQFSVYRGNIENIVGFAAIPIGIAGPLRLSGQQAHGEFFIPLATTEGSLVASYNRGMKAITASGGATARVTQNQMFSSLTLFTPGAQCARDLLCWIDENGSRIKTAAESTTRHGKFVRAEATLHGSRVLLNLVYDPGDAMGINMITSASFAAAQLICEYNEHTDFLLPSAFQGDKKASFYSFSMGRGRSVEATALIEESTIKDILKSTSDDIYRNYLNNLETSHLVGSMGFNMHIANGITALGLATGQDVAYVSESSSGHLIVEKAKDGLLFSLKIPSLYVGTVGGGTGLPTHKPCLELLGCTGPGSAIKLAEIMAGVCLSGEISVLAAIASQHFVQAHNRLGRNRPAQDDATKQHG